MPKVGIVDGIKNRWLSFKRKFHVPEEKTAPKVKMVQIPARRRIVAFKHGRSIYPRITSGAFYGKALYREFIRSGGTGTKQA